MSFVFGFILHDNITVVLCTFFFNLASARIRRYLKLNQLNLQLGLFITISLLS
jgi:hypothetical protein